MKAMLVVVAFIAAANSLASAQEAPKCLDAAPAALKDGEILFLYVSEDQPEFLQPLVIFDGTNFKEIHNRYFQMIKEVYRIDNGKTYEISYDTYSAQVGSDKCYWMAKLEQSKKTQNAIFSFPQAKLNTKIDSSLTDQFYSLNTACINQLDESNNPKTSCTKPILKGVSDLNNNGRFEFWFTSPHQKDTGFAVAELDSSGTKLETIAER